MEGQAQNLGGNLDCRERFEFLRALPCRRKARNPADIQRVARHFFTRRKPHALRAFAGGTAPKRSKAVVETIAETAHPKIRIAQRPAPLFKADHACRSWNFAPWFQGGVLAETAANNGLTQLLTKMLLKGTARRTAEQIATEIESVGGHIVQLRRQP